MKKEKAPRIREERKRLGYNSQTEAADACGVKKQQWGRYERGEQSMSPKVLASFGELGADTSYILTGIRSTPEEMRALMIGLNSEYHKNGEKQDMDTLAVSAALNKTVNRERHDAVIAEHRNNLFERAMQTKDIDRLHLAGLVLQLDNSDFEVMKAMGLRLNQKG